MDVRIGVLNNTVWRHDFETRKQLLDETGASKGRNDRQLFLISEAQEMGELNEEED